MYRNKNDVDKHVKGLASKISSKELKSRAYSIGRLYFDVGDYASCQKYVEQYLSMKDDSAAAHKLLGQAFQKQDLKEKALEEYKISLDIDPTQTSLILDICELLDDDEVFVDPGRAKSWCEKSEAIFPRHPVTFRLRERLMTTDKADPDTLLKLIKSELVVRPKDGSLHARLFKHYLQINKVKEAFEHSCNIEFGDYSILYNNDAWYEALVEFLKHDSHDGKSWLYQALLLTVKERLCFLSITETPGGTTKSVVESTELLHLYDQAILKVSQLGAPAGFAEFHKGLIQHHSGQLAFHTATLILKKAKKSQSNWNVATKISGPLMLMAWHTVPLDTKVSWLSQAPEKQKTLLNRWYVEGTYRCSQAGHYLLTNMQDKSQAFLDSVAQTCSGPLWRNKIFESIFTAKDQLVKSKTSYISSNAFSSPTLRLPRRNEVEAYDSDAQRQYPNSLHHIVWILLNYKNFSNFKCTLFENLNDKLVNNISNNYSSTGPETLNKLDVLAYLYSAALTSQNQKNYNNANGGSQKPKVLPANITDLVCPLQQIKWWDCAYKFCQNQLGSELSDIRATLSRGIEVMRCVDNHGLDAELLCLLGRIFGEKAKSCTDNDEKNNLEARANLYYSSAIPLLQKYKSKLIVKIPEKRIFDFNHTDLGTKELNALLEESKVYVANMLINNGDYEKAIEILRNLQCPLAYLYMGQAYKKMATENQSNKESKQKYVFLLSKAKSYAYQCLEKLKDSQEEQKNSTYLDTQNLIEEIESTSANTDLESDFSPVINELEGKYSSDENSADSEYVSIHKNANIFRNVSSTPKHPSSVNVTNYRTAVDSQIFENSRNDQKYFERIENQIKGLQKRDATISTFMEQTKTWFEENKSLGNQIMNTINSNIQNTTDQFKLLKISVDQVKDQIDECRNECKDVGELKKQVTDLKKEVNKLKKSYSKQHDDENELYNLEEEYRSNESTSNFTAPLPFANPQLMSQFNQRLVPPFPVPPNPYQIYGQNLYNFYNQYTQFTQASAVPGTPSMFDSVRTQLGYPGVYVTPEQMYPDVAHLIPPTVPVPSMPTIPPPAAVPPPVIQPAVIPPPVIPPISAPKQTPALTKESSRQLPVNVVITSSDPLPTTTTVPQPVLSVTIPQKHIKNTPLHNYQIQMPSVIEPQTVPPPMMTEAVLENNANKFNNVFSSWTQANVPKTSENTFSLFGSNNSSSLNNSVSAADSAVFGASLNTSQNKSRTLSEKSNTSIDNYDPCPDFKPIVPLPAEVAVTTGEEDETVIFNSRAKLYRFTDKQWKERGVGEMKLLKHKVTGKVRVLMRREQIHKICANHLITPEIEIQPMKNEPKAYFWVANDFADETVVLEKFCIRFKTAETAKQFYDTFENARKTAKSSPKTDTKKTEPQPPTLQQSTPIKDVTPSQGSKTVVGGFTFSSTPTFKPLKEDKTETKATVTPTATANPFSAISFKTSNASPLTNLLNLTNNQASPIVAPATSAKENESNQNTSDLVEEFVPSTEFVPVIPLPELIDHKTGEEDETILFEHRAKLLRFISSSKEWKERGLGNIKILARKDDPQKVRILMRREQVMKVCCNHAVTKDMTFEKMPKMDKAVTWCAKDFSEGELIPETFCLRFKTVQVCDDFINSLKKAQSKMQDDSATPKESKVENTVTSSKGFGDKFKPKSGSWQCDMCYTNNLETFSKCACCEQAKPQKEDKSVKSIAPDSTTTKTNTTSTSNWGDKFKPKAGSWECSQCLIRNEASLEICNACNSPKDPSAPKKETMPTGDSSLKFNFGIASNTTSSNDNTKKESLFGTQSQKFSFGIPASTTVSVSEVKADTTSKPSLLDGSGGVHKFSFGIPTTQQNSTPASLSGSSVIFAAPKKPLEQNTTPINFSIKQNDTSSVITISAVKPSLLSTPQKEPTLSLGGKESGTFDFKFKPKTTLKTKSPVKSPGNGEDSDDNEYASEDEGHHIHFSPVIPMPDKITVVTGEENEEELYAHRAKLYRFTAGEWKERGLGVVKILKHNDTGKLRVVMRREQVLKICLNHALTQDIKYTAKDDKTWLFTVNDFSDGELDLSSFCLRFKTKEISLEFKEAIDNAISGKQNVSKSNDDDVVFVKEIQATPEEQKKAKELMLPENFYTYKNKTSCQGCRGCKDDESSSGAPDVAYATPNKNIINVSNSVYNTPFNLNKTGDTSIFRTPLESIGSNNKSNSAFSVSLNNGNQPGTDKENSSVPKTNVSDQHLTLSDLLKKPSTLFNTDAQTPTSTKSSILAAPKLSTTLGSQEKENQTSKPKALFGLAVSKSLFATPTTTQSPSIFGTPTSSENKSIFGANTTTSIFGTPSDTSKISLFGKKDETTESTTAFGIKPEQKPTNMFGSATQPAGLFGSVLKNSQEGSTFGSSNTSIFGGFNLANTGNTSIFSKPNATDSQKPIWSFGLNVDQKDNALNKTAEVNPAATKPDPVKTESTTPFKIDTNLSFASLSTSATGFNANKNTDFKWEGTGQQLFKGDKSKGGGDEQPAEGEEEYDPHYEPIVPLPDKIVVTTGEEDEEKLFGERCKLYRFEEKNSEWKERGTGEIKILYHPERKTYRMLLRREQVHKAVLNMLVFADLELLPMRNSDRAWTWAGVNYAEEAGAHETLAVRFKNIDLSNAFRDKVVECTRKLQAAAAKAIREQKEQPSEGVAPLRLPKHLQDTSRADSSILAATSQLAQGGANGQPQNTETHDADDTEDYDQHYEDSDNYEDYYNEEESAPLEADVSIDGSERRAALVQVLFDADLEPPKVLVADRESGEVLVDMPIYTETYFQLNDNSCTWTGCDYTSDDPGDKTVTLHFDDNDSAIQFYDSCENSKSVTYSANDPES